MTDTKKITSDHNGRTRLWTVPKELKGEKSFEDIMQDNGYHPAGYGGAFDITEDEENFYFKSWNNCD